MNPHISVVTALLISIAHNGEYHHATVAPEEDFVAFDLSYLRDFSGRGEPAKIPFEGHGQNASDALPA
jgi:hypothetical protein